jgi:uncharacterized protein (TIGR00725 family)
MDALTAAGPRRIRTGFPSPLAGREHTIAAVASAVVYVAVAGAGRASVELERLAEEVGRRLAEAGATVVTGGLGGVMDAASRGAAAAGGQVIAIVPGESRAEATAHATAVVATGTGQARNLAIAATCDGMIAVGGEWGTLSEIGLAGKLGRPVVALAGWEVRGVDCAGDPADAVERLFGLLGQSRSNAG